MVNLTRYYCSSLTHDGNDQFEAEVYLASDVDPLLTALEAREQEIEELRRTCDSYAERDLNIALLDLITRSKSPCGHWGSHAYSPEGKGKQILCLDCENAALTARAEAAESDVIRMATTKVGEKCEHHKSSIAKQSTSCTVRR